MRTTKRSIGVLAGILAVGWADTARPQDSASARDSAVVFEATLPGGPDAAARLLGLAPAPPPERLLTELVRRLYDAPHGQGEEVRERLSRLQAAGPAVPAGRDVELAAAVRVPVPLSPEAWSAILHRDVTADNALGAILGDRRAALLAYGLAALDEPTRRFLAGSPGLLGVLHGRAAAPFASFGRSLRVRDGRVQLPGGDPTRALWEQAVGVALEPADRFILRLFDHGDDGRLAYLYDAIANVDEPRARFALGLWIAEEGRRLERFTALSGVVARSFRREWQPSVRPFSRLPADAALTLMAIEVTPEGEPAPPGRQLLWDRVFDGVDLPDDPARRLAGLPGSRPVDAAFLLDHVLVSDPGGRAERLATFTFAQRVFAHTSADEAADVFVALRGRRAFPSLMATLERLEIDDASVYAAGAQRALEISRLRRDEAAVALRQFQSSLALLARLRQRRVIDRTLAGELTRSLIAVDLDGRRGYRGALAAWLAERLLPALGAPPQDTLSHEARLVAGLAGQGGAAEAGMPRFVTWEGHAYRMDLVAAEILRLERVRARQGGPTLDEALDAVRAAVRLRARPGSLDALHADAATLAAAIDDAPRRLDSAAAAGWPPPVEPASRALAQLGRIRDERDLNRAVGLSAPLVALADAILADALASITYAVAIGDPDSRALIGENMARRHDFGLMLPDRRAQRNVAWALPEQRIQPGEPWHVRGSLLALDVALASFGLRRVVLDGELRAPVLNSSDRRTLVDTVALVNPFALTDGDRNAITGALAAGRERVARVAIDADALEALVQEARLDGWRRQELVWLAANGSDRVTEVFSLAELVWLGRPPPSVDLAAWGMSALATRGCLCTRFPAPGEWRNYAGRPGLGLIAAEVADLTLRVAELLAELELPATLTRDVLSAATLEFVDRVEPAHEDDWRTLVITARRLTRERVEDYMSALAAGGPLIPDGAADPRELRR